MMQKALAERSGLKCEMCGHADGLETYNVPPKPGEHVDEQVCLCMNCMAQVSGIEEPDPVHWRCLSDSIWSEVPAVKVVSWRMLQKLSSEGWANDLLHMMYLDEESMAWAESGAAVEISSDEIHKDAFGNVLNAGDTVVLLKELDVKGANFAAKRGTAVRKISLVEGNAGQIEGRVNDQQIVILTKFVKKSS
ncbi:MAG: PhnA domain-containing protein [Saprospiraceae bacterium]|nr:PhnA domain-containing protein [Saprospiraceae bacterium]